MKVTLTLLLIILLIASFFGYHFYTQNNSLEARYIKSCLEYSNKAIKSSDDKQRATVFCQCTYGELKKIESDEMIKAYVDANFSPKSASGAMVAISQAQASVSCVSKSLESLVRDAQ